MSARRALRVVPPLLVAAAAAAACWWLFATAPVQEKVTPRTEAPVVEVAPIEPATSAVTAEAFGTVVPAREVHLAPQVSGRVVEVSPDLVPGGFVREGDLLLKVEAADYELAVAQARAALDQTQADLALEEGRRLVAEREWERFGPELETLGDEADRAKSRALALREPQLRRMQALVSAAETTLAEAELELSRTSLAAPFDAVVLAESVEVGLVVRSGETVVRLAGTDEFWIKASLPAGRASRVAAGNRRAVRVERAAGFGGGPDGAPIEGRLLRVLPDLDPEGRMAQVLVAVDDPLALRDLPDNGGGQHREPLPLGSYVRLELPAGSLGDVVRVPREALRENDRVWLLGGDGRLRVREVEVAWRETSEVLVRASFAPDERLVTSYLSHPLPGMELRVRGDPTPPAPETGTD